MGTEASELERAVASGSQDYDNAVRAARAKATQRHTESLAELTGALQAVAELYYAKIGAAWDGYLAALRDLGSGEPVLDMKAAADASTEALTKAGAEHQQRLRATAEAYSRLAARGPVPPQHAVAGFVGELQALWANGPVEDEAEAARLAWLAAVERGQKYAGKRASEVWSETQAKLELAVKDPELVAAWETALRRYEGALEEITRVAGKEIEEAAHAATAIVRPAWERYTLAAKLGG